MEPAAAAQTSLLETIKPLVPIPVLLVLLPALWWFFREHVEASSTPSAPTGAPKLDGRRARPTLRPFVALVAVRRHPHAAGVLRRPHLLRAGAPAHAHALGRRCTRSVWKLAKYDELYGFGWWAVRARRPATSSPFPVWKLFFREDSCSTWACARAASSSTRGSTASSSRIVLPLLLVVSRQPDFGAYYPFYGKLLALLVRLPLVGGDVLRAVLRPRDVLPRLLARGAAAQLRLGRHLRDGRAVLHDPLRQAVPRGERRHHRGHRARVARRCGRRASTRGSWCTSPWRR